MVFQNYALYPNKTVYKNLAFPLKMRKTPKAEIDRRVREAAKVLDIEHLLERRPRELSGGQQQRVALGRALVRDPKVFLMDEPLSNLDAKLRVQMRAELKRFHQDLNATVIYVTHDQLEAVTMADRMAVMNGGVLQQYDRPERVFEHPVNTFVAGFVGSPAMNLLKARRRERRRRRRAARARTVGGSRFRPRNARRALAAASPEVVAGRAPQHAPAVAGSRRRRHSGPGLHGRADRRRDLRPRPDRRGDRRRQRAAARPAGAEPADLARVRPGEAAPVRRRDRKHADGVLGRGPRTSRRARTRLGDPA